MKLKAIVSGLATYVPGYRAMRQTGGTDSARYCYAVWLRHLALVNSMLPGRGVPRSVAELGPGDSIGIGLAALLSGAEKYYAFDVVAYSDLRSNLAIFDELLELFRRREPIPDDVEFPSLYPRLDDYGFPQDLLCDEHLAETLDASRVAEIRDSISVANGRDSRIVYRAPWGDSAVIEDATIDMIYSQAVLEHVVDLEAVYRAMRRWLSADGIMSHQIDYRCHGKAESWNGHWTYSDLVWKLIVGKRPYLLNRVPHSGQMRALRTGGFEALGEVTVKSASAVGQQQLARRFREMSMEDLSTSGAYVVSRPLIR